MVWYNPKTWFRREEQPAGDSNLELICANPQCRGIIVGDNIAYIPEFNEFYHPGECPQIAIGHKLMKSGAPHIYVEDVQYPSRKEAIAIIKKRNKLPLVKFIPKE